MKDTLNTKIQWTDFTINFWRGCQKVDADCRFCYFYRDMARYGKDGKDFVLISKSTIKSKIIAAKQLANSRMANLDTTPVKIFLSSWTDVFLEQADPYRHIMWDVIRDNPNIIFQILTKRPERIFDHLPTDWGDGWDNVWLGTSIGSNEGMKRLYPLIETPAKVRFVSFEPLWERIDMNLDISTLIAIDWAIIGGESGNDTGKYRYRPCQIGWITEIADAINGVGNHVFIKQLGTHLAKEMKLKDRHGGDINEWPGYLQIREFPKRKEVSHA